MKLVYVRNKENGTTYVYESRYYWNREKRQSRSRRVCIGKLDGEGNLIPSARFSKPLPETIANQEGVMAGRPAKRLYFGGVYLLEEIGWTEGFIRDLRVCFPDCYRQLLSVIYFLILEGQAPLDRIEKWSRAHWHPAGEDLSPGQVIRLLERLSGEAEARFLALQEKRRKGRPEAARLQDIFPPADAGASPGERMVCGMGFTVLCAMILLSAVLTRMAGNGFFKGRTAQQVFDRLDLIECTEGPDGRPEEGLLSGEEERLLAELGVSPPEVSEADRPVQ